MTPGYLELQIRSRRKRLAAIEAERAALVGELAAYEDALAHTNPGSTEPVDFVAIREPEGSLPVSRAWFTILQRLAGYTHFNASDVMRVAQTLYGEDKLRKPQTNDGVRAQLSLYTKKGIIKRRGGGNYLLTDKTKILLELGIEKVTQPKTAIQSPKLVWARADDSGPNHGG